MIMISEEKCNGCGMCRDSCPQEALAVSKKKAVLIEAKCIECGTCVDICPEWAMQFPAEDAA
jgi:Fe-S-cluster-containing hydrogenase component 2